MSEEAPAKKPRTDADVKLTERQQVALALKESSASAGLGSSSEDEKEESVPETEKTANKINDGAEVGFAEDDDDDENLVEAPGMVSEATAAQRWWEGSEGFDFANSRAKQNEEDGMRSDLSGDPHRLVGKLVKRSFGRGVVSFGKVMGWFPADKDQDLLYHVLHGDGDEEDLDASEAVDAVAWASRDETKKERGGKQKRRRGALVDSDDDEEQEFGSDDSGGGGGESESEEDGKSEDGKGGEAAARREAAGLVLADFDSAKEQARAVHAVKARARSDALAALLGKPCKYNQGNRGDAVEAAVRGVHFLFSQVSQSPLADANLAQFGSDVVQTLYDISAVAPDPIRKAALQRVEVVSQKWKARFKRLSDLSEDARTSTAAEVTDAVLGLHCLERVGLEHPLKAEVAAFLRTSKLTPFDFVGFELGRPSALLAPHHKLDKFTLLTSALNTAYAADKVGVSLGGGSHLEAVTLVNVMSHVRCLRPYKHAHKLQAASAASSSSSFSPSSSSSSSSSLSDEEWTHQITLVFNVVHVCSNFGELRLVGGTGLKPEFDLLAHSSSMESALRLKDVHVVGELCHCLRVFGLDPKTSTSLGQGLSFLVEAQRDVDGSWPTRDDDDGPYSKYHAAMCATMALYQPLFRGFGPGSSDLKALLQKWARKDKRLLTTAPSGVEQGGGCEGEAGTLALLSSQGGQASVLAAVEEAYSGGSGAVNSAARSSSPLLSTPPLSPRSSASSALGLEERAEARVRSLLRWKKAILSADAHSLDTFRSEKSAKAKRLLRAAAKPPAAKSGDDGRTCVPASGRSGTVVARASGRSSEVSRRRALELSKRAPERTIATATAAAAATLVAGSEASASSSAGKKRVIAAQPDSGGGGGGGGVEEATGGGGAVDIDDLI